MYVGCRFVDDLLLGLVDIFCDVSVECTGPVFMADESGSDGL